MLIDVRTERELNVDGKIPGSHNIPIAKIVSAFKLKNDEFLQKYGFEKPSKDYLNVVLTCQVGGRANFARKLLQKEGYNHLRVYEGSFLDWSEKDGQICLSSNKDC